MSRLAYAGLIAASWMGLSACQDAEPQINQADVLSVSCSSCHGAGGTALADLSGWEVDALETALQSYKTESGQTVMHRMMRGYSDAEIAMIAQAVSQTE